MNEANFEGNMNTEENFSDEEKVTEAEIRELERGNESLKENTEMLNGLLKELDRIDAKGDIGPLNIPE